MRVLSALVSRLALRGPRLPAAGGLLLALGIVALAIGCARDEGSVSIMPVTSGQPAQGQPGPGASGAPAAERVAIPAPSGAPSEAALRGTIRYEDRLYGPSGFTGELRIRPARGILVRALDAGGALRASTRTDGEGAFLLRVDAPPGESLRVQAVADVMHREHRLLARTDHPGGRPHLLELPAFVVGATPASSEAIAPASGVGGAFNAMDVAYEALRALAPVLPKHLPTLTVIWERGRARPCTSCYRDEDETIQLGADPSDTDEYDDDIILHELAHFFAQHTHADDNPGGFHRDRRVSPALAYPEGLAYFLSCLVRDDPRVIDTYDGANRVWDFERVTIDGLEPPETRGTSDGRVGGLLREEIPGSILWDVSDPASPEEPFDRITLPVEVHLRLLLGGVQDRPARGGRGIDLVDYLDALVCTARLPAEDVLALATSRGFPWLAPDCDALPPIAAPPTSGAAIPPSPAR
ncbi:MAG: hypothetical protein OEY14_06745 [Myxococcales bacterium]|nr:hypothetical protein [Myxococcales bacterium]